METWLLDWSYMKNTTRAWYLKGENTISFNCRMLLQTCKTAGEGKQMSCFKWWRMNRQTPIAEDWANLKIWDFSFFIFFLFPFLGGGASILQEGEILSWGVTCVCHGFSIYLWTVFFFLFWACQSICVRLKCSAHLLVVFHEPLVCAEVKGKIRNIICFMSSNLPLSPYSKNSSFLKK